MSKDHIKDYVGVGIEVNTNVWMHFKTLVVKKGLKLKYAVSQALSLWIQKNKETL